MVRGEGLKARASARMVRRRAVAVGWAAWARRVRSAEHGGAEVDCVGGDVRVGGEEGGGEAAVAVAEDEGVAVRRPGGQKCGRARWSAGAEGEVFEQTVGAGEEVEVRVREAGAGSSQEGQEQARV